MNDDLTRYILDLEGRVAALSGMLGALMWILNHRRILDKGLEQQIYRSTSDAIVTAHPEIEAAADRLILAMQQASCAAQPSVPDLGGTEP
ncbi:MAG TPA: hypothetical protein VHO91_13305 [Rhodopila sp.]|nr:hypothetical protein [Rhodopila sp.]